MRSEGGRGFEGGQTKGGRLTEWAWWMAVNSVTWRGKIGCLAEREREREKCLIK